MSIWENQAYLRSVIRRFYVHNFRCLENFELSLAGNPTILLIGKNGSGKSTVGKAFEILQQIARGTNRVADLVKPKDFSQGRTESPMRFEIEVDLGGKHFQYSLALEFPEGFKELRVFEEKLLVQGSPVFTRQIAQVQLSRNEEGAARFLLDWHLIALPLVQEAAPTDSLQTFKRWLARFMVLRPMPTLITGDSTEETLQPNKEVTNLGAWFSGLMKSRPAAYSDLDRYLKDVMPDIFDIQNPQVGKEATSLEVQFSIDQGTLKLPFAELSDGEKCFIICGMVLAANKAYGPLVCFWDEPDNFLALSEVGHFVMALRKAFQSGGQFITTSHNPEAIRRFSDENTILLLRKNHLEPTQARLLKEMNVQGDLIGALIRGDLEQ